MRPPRPAGRRPGAPTPAVRSAAGAVLDHLRAAVLVIARAVPPELRDEPLVLPGVSILAIVRHLTDLEREWFAFTFAGLDAPHGCPTGDGVKRWHGERDDPAVALLAYRTECARSRAITAGAVSGATSERPGPDGDHVSLDWILLHMIAETGRHAGQADILRRLIDGTTGPLACGAPRPWR